MANAAVIGRKDSAILREVFPEGADVFADMGERWKTRVEALMKDAEIGITRPKPIAPTDYIRTNAEAIVTGHFGMRLPSRYKVNPES